MKIYCNRNELNRALSNVSHSVPARTTTDILEGILVEASDNVMKLTATDTNITIESRMPAGDNDLTVLEKAYLASCDNQEIGMASLLLGGGRRTKDEVIDLSVGIRLYKHLGDSIEKDEPVATLYANDERKLDEAAERFVKAYKITENPEDKNPVIYAHVD